MTRAQSYTLDFRIARESSGLVRDTPKVFVTGLCYSRVERPDKIKEESGFRAFQEISNGNFFSQSIDD